MDALTADVNPTEIYASDDMLAMDSYFSLLHYATGEEVVADAEWKYFLDCLNGNRVYSLDVMFKNGVRFLTIETFVIKDYYCYSLSMIATDYTAQEAVQVCKSFRLDGMPLSTKL